MRIPAHLLLNSMKPTQTPSYLQELTLQLPVPAVAEECPVLSIYDESDEDTTETLPGIQL